MQRRLRSLLLTRLGLHADREQVLRGACVEKEVLPVGLPVEGRAVHHLRAWNALVTSKVQARAVVRPSGLIARVRSTRIH